MNYNRVIKTKDSETIDSLIDRLAERKFEKMIKTKSLIKYRLLRMNAGMTLKEASKILDISSSNLQNIEKGRVEVSVDFINKLNNLYKINFKMPSVQELTNIAILFNNGNAEIKKISDMVAMCNLVLDRLHENGDISIKSSKEYIKKY